VGDELLTEAGSEKPEVRSEVQKPEVLKPQGFSLK
jgi:hypothetical protein